MFTDLTIEPIEMEFEMVAGLEVATLPDMNVIGSNSHYDHIETSPEEIRLGRYIRQSIAAEQRMITTINNGLTKATKMSTVNKVVTIAKREGVWRQCRQAVKEANARIKKAEDVYRNGVVISRDNGNEQKLVSSKTNNNPRAYASRMAKHGWNPVRCL